MKFKVAIRKKQLNKEGKVNVKIRVFHHHKAGEIATDYYVDPNYFDKKLGLIKAGPGFTQDEADRANTRILIRKGQMAEKGLNQKRSIDMKALLVVLRDERLDHDLYSQLDDKIEKYKDLGNVNYQHTVECTKAMLERLEGKGMIPFSLVTPSWLSSLETKMRVKKMKTNSIGVHMRNIRTAYNDAINKGMANLLDYPFRSYKIPREATRKRNLTGQEIATIYHKELSDPLMRWARDMFILSFFLMGINTVDLFKLKNIEDGRIYYIRSKGKRPYNIKVWPEAQEIIDRYPGKKYLLNAMDKYTDYRNARARVNDKLKRIAELCKIEKEISTYYCRHSWATIGRREVGVSVDDISVGLGHQRPSKEMTVIYLDEDQEVIDNANRKIIDHIFRTLPSE